MPVGLVIVDTQNDFCPGGALPAPDGDAVIAPLNTYIAWATAQGVPVFASRDWHPVRTAHFAPYGGPWPVHCVQNTLGAAFHPELRLPPDTRVITKGTTERDEGYSAFEGTLPDGADLATALHGMGITRVLVGGLTTDYCVKATALAAHAAGFEVTLLTDAIRAVDVAPGDGERAIDEMRRAGATLQAGAPGA